MALTGRGSPDVTGIDSGGHRARFLARRDELVTGHLELVRQIARRIHASLPPSFDLDDLFAEGYAALLQAATRYRPREHGGAPFSAYARPRIRGAILDSVTGRHYRENTGGEIDAETLAGAPSNVEEMIDRNRRLERVERAIERLPPRQAEVIREYYSADAPGLRIVARRLHTSFGTVWQLHAEAIRELRELLDDPREAA
jgi:RNA polymerase sigma factor (sigma-70 family)